MLTAFFALYVLVEWILKGLQQHLARLHLRNFLFELTSSILFCSYFSSLLFMSNSYRIKSRIFSNYAKHHILTSVLQISIFQVIEIWGMIKNSYFAGPSAYFIYSSNLGLENFRILMHFHEVQIYPCPKGSARHRAMVRELGGKEQYALFLDVLHNNHLICVRSIKISLTQFHSRWYVHFATFLEK